MGADNTWPTESLQGGLQESNACVCSLIVGDTPPFVRDAHLTRSDSYAMSFSLCASDRLAWSQVQASPSSCARTAKVSEQWLERDCMLDKAVLMHNPQASRQVGALAASRPAMEVRCHSIVDILTAITRSLCVCRPKNFNSCSNCEVQQGCYYGHQQNHEFGVLMPR